MHQWQKIKKDWKNNFLRMWLHLMALNFVESSNVLIVPLEIKLTKLDKLQEAAKKLRETKREFPEGTLPKTPGMPTDDLQNILDREAVGLKKGFVGAKDSSLSGMLQNQLGPKGVTNIMQFAKNPIRLISLALTNPYIVPIIGVIATGAVLHELLVMRGGVFDLNFRRVVTQETIKGRSRQEKEKIRVGIGAGVVITTHSGYTTPEYAFNSFEAVRSGQMENVRAFQIRRGYAY